MPTRDSNVYSVVKTTESSKHLGEIFIYERILLRLQKQHLFKLVQFEFYVCDAAI